MKAYESSQIFLRSEKYVVSESIR